MIRSGIIISTVILVITLVSGTHSGAVNTGEPVMVTDKAGRSVSVKKPFRRIISLYGAHTENLFELGADDRLIGVSRHEVYPPEALKRKRFSYHDGPEKFIAESPDLVLIRPMIDRGYARLVRQLEGYGITVVSLQPAGVEELFEYWKTLGVLTGKETRADQMIAEFQSGVDQVKDLTQGIGIKKRVYFEAIHRQMKTFSSDSITMYALKTAGGINIADDAMASRGTNIGIYGKERIISQADTIDVFLVQTGRMNNATVDTIRNEPGFHTIKAVKAGDIYLIDEMLVSRPTLRLLQGIRIIGNVLYPDVFSIDIAAQ